MIKMFMPGNKFSKYVHLEGWSQSVHENLSDFDEVLGELAEKWGAGSTSPELRLLFIMATSAFMYSSAQSQKAMMSNATMNNLEQAMANSGISNEA